MIARMLRTCLLAAILTAAAAAETPVLVELFTSEGCSSCPPADVLLAKLESMQPVPGAHIIALSEHVDYWDRLGWRDPFSSSLFTERQQEYARLFHDDGPYTPEMVIDGATGFVGVEGERALKTIAQSAQAPKTAVRLTAASGKVSVRVDDAPRAADLLLAITERNLLSNVSAGENKGLRLTHTAVVRSLRTVGKVRRGEPFAAEVAVEAAKSWKPENLRAVVILQDRSTHKVMGAAEIPLAMP